MTTEYDDAIRRVLDEIHVLEQSWYHDTPMYLTAQTELARLTRLRCPPPDPSAPPPIQVCTLKR